MPFETEEERHTGTALGRDDDDEGRQRASLNPVTFVLRRKGRLPPVCPAPEEAAQGKSPIAEVHSERPSLCPVPVGALYELEYTYSRAGVYCRISYIWDI